MIAAGSKAPSVSGAVGQGEVALAVVHAQNVTIMHCGKDEGQS